MAFDPPAIKHAQAWNSVYSCLHTAGARCFQWRLWRVEPEIDDRGQELCEVQVIVDEIRDRERVPQRFPKLTNPLDKQFAFMVTGVSLACEHDLQAAGVSGDSFQLFDVAKNEVRSLIGGESTSESDGQDVRIKV